MDEETRRKKIERIKMQRIFSVIPYDKPQLVPKWTSPKYIESVPKQIYYQYYTTIDDSDTFNLLPLPYHESRHIENGRKLSLVHCEHVNEKWVNFLDMPASSKKLMIHYPTSRLVHFKNCKLQFNPMKGIKT